MSLPPGFLDELRTRTSLTQVVGRKVIWDTRKSNQGKGDMWAPCPFHQEKTASFHVDDRKGFYYCFGCHAKGDAIGFVKETENVEFMEAVRILAAEAGMTLPERDPQAQAKADKRTQLFDVMEMAVSHFKLQLKTGAGSAARDYLTGRGLGEKTQERFEIGFAADAWQGLWDHLKNKGVSDEMILECGLAKPSQRGGRPYDTFRGRIMFPIRDPRGRCIAFGGRAMDPNDNAKYLNSPETLLFDKSRTLYHLGPAREAAGKGQPLIVAEGYMDVIALASSGFDASVAPLGTAITEAQLQMLWRVADEPIVALDGDTAGLRAAYRAIDLALPLLEAGKSLRFIVLPEGKDPDDLLRSEGRAAFQKLLDTAQPMVRLLWQRETEGRVFDSPERKAALDKALRECIRTIKDPSIRSHYGQEVKDLRWQLFSGGQQSRKRGQSNTWGKKTPSGALASTKSSLLAVAGDEAQVSMRETVILATVALNPELADEFDTALHALDCRSPQNAYLRDVILAHAHTGKEALAGQIGHDALESLMAHPHVALSPAVRTPKDAAMARMAITEELAKLEALRGLENEVSEAAEDIAALADEAVTWRLSQAAEARNRALRSEQEDTQEFDRGDNGAEVKRDEKEEFNALLDKITFSKPGQ